MWDTNKASRQAACTTYVGHWCPLEYQRVPHLGLPLVWNLNARAKLAGLVSTRTPDGNSGRKTENKKERHGGISLSRNGSISLFFRFAYILFVIHRDEYRVMQGSADQTLVKIRCFI